MTRRSLDLFLSGYGKVRSAAAMVRRPRAPTPAERAEWLEWSRHEDALRRRAAAEFRWAVLEQQRSMDPVERGGHDA